MTAVASPLRVEIDWPVKELWSNGSFGNRFVYQRAANQARDDAYWATRQAMGAQRGPGTTQLKHDGEARIELRLIAHPKTRHAVDEQNLASGLKAHFDGVAKAIGIDDKFFKLPVIEWAEPMKGGRVILEIAA